MSISQQVAYGFQQPDRITAKDGHIIFDRNRKLMIFLLKLWFDHRNSRCRQQMNFNGVTEPTAVYINPPKPAEILA